MFSVRVSEDQAVRFDAAAAGAGGRSALLRRLINEAGVGPEASPGRSLRQPRTGARLMVRLTPADAALVDRQSHEMGLRRAAWVAGLVSAHVRGRPTFAASDHGALAAIAGEIRRIGVNVNQIARALNTAVLEGRVLDAELTSISALQNELRAHVFGLREAFAGNLAYWDTAW
ncbi:MobC family plasmid mobilization relaxosome protein [Phenylobacterium zucineum]|nr:MobC family plasmid mobilization relaxosome protein [Phenylobacterium zucineum]